MNPASRIKRLIDACSDDSRCDNVINKPWMDGSFIEDWLLPRNAYGLGELLSNTYLGMDIDGC